MSEFKAPAVEYNNYLIVPFEDSLDDEKIQNLKSWIIEKICRHENLRGVVLDLSAVRLVDSYIARILGEIASSLFMEGTRCVISGIRPEVAITLVEMGVVLSEIPTALNVDHAVELLESTLESDYSG
ncbi:MAG: STAS domain-containing protein [bacterium]